MSNELENLAPGESLEALFTRLGDDLFALCYLHVREASGACALLRQVVFQFSLPSSKGQSQEPEERLLSMTLATCKDFHTWGRKRQNQLKTGKGLDPVGTPGGALPFVLTDTLRLVQKLSPSQRSLVFLLCRLGRSPQQAAALLRCPTQRVAPRLAAALKKTDCTEEKMKSQLASLALGGERLANQWDLISFHMGEKNFLSSQKTKVFFKALDNAIPYIALAIVVFLILAVIAVQQNWFSTGSPSSAAPTSSVKSAELPVGNSFRAFLPGHTTNLFDPQHPIQGRSSL